MSHRKSQDSQHPSCGTVMATALIQVSAATVQPVEQTDVKNVQFCDKEVP